MIAAPLLALIYLVGPPTVPPGETYHFDLMLSGASDYTALQFSITGVEEMTGSSVIPGKQLFCTQVEDHTNCIIAGGNSAIPEGKVATFIVPPGTVGKKVITLSNVFASKVEAVDGISVDTGDPLEFQVAVSCQHTLAGYPVGDLLVFRNGVLKKSPEDYVAVGSPIVVSPVDAQDGNLWSAVYFRRVAVTREDWTCK